MPGIVRTPMVDDDGSGTTGTILNNAWKQELYDQINALAASAWITPPFVASDYFAPAGSSWTVVSGNVLSCAYCVMGRLLFFDLNLNGTTIGGTAPVNLSRKPFGGIPIGAHTSGGTYAFTNDVAGVGLWASVPSTQINFFRNILGSPAWVGGAFGCRVQGFYEIA